jgi:hypothetical protein
MTTPGKPAIGYTVLRVPAIQSPNFVAGTSGWAIFQDGTAEFNDVISFGGLVELLSALGNYDLAAGTLGAMPANAMTVTGPTGGEVAFQSQDGTSYGWLPVLLGQLTILASTPATGGLRFIPPSGDTTGATDAAAINGALGVPLAVQLLPGTYYVNAPVTMPSNAMLQGCGRGATIIQLAAAVNGPILVSADFAALTGTGSNTQGATGFILRDLVLDGNAPGQTAAAAAAVQVFGYDFDIQDVSIRNFLATDGLYTEFGPGGQPGPEGAMEARYERLRIHGNTLTGAAWHNRGPHDSHATSLIIYQNTDNAIGYHSETSASYQGSACLLEQAHVWGSHSVGYQLDAQTQCVECIAEGAASINVYATGSDSSWTGGQVFPAGGTGQGFQLGTLSASCNGFTMANPEIIGFAGTSAANCAIQVISTASGWYEALIYQPSGQAIFGALQAYEHRKFSYGGLVTPSVAAGAGAGTGAPAPTLAGAGDNRGQVNMGTGTGPTGGLQATVTYAQPAPGGPSVAIWPGNAATAALNPYLDGSSSTGFGVGFATAPAAGQATGTYAVGYANVT